MTTLKIDPVCWCGDYLSQHDSGRSRGNIYSGGACRVCRGSNAPWDNPPYGPCAEFRYSAEATAGDVADQIKHPERPRRI